MNRRSDGVSVTHNDTGTPDSSKKARSRRSVYIYVATLFIVVLGFILLSYFMQQRNNTEINALNEKNLTAEQHLENLQDTNIDLQSENDSLKTQITDLEQQITDLENELKDVRKNWLNDVQDIMNTDKTKYNELLDKYNALIKKYGIKVNNND